jgi:hypothetical protein
MEKMKFKFWTWPENPETFHIQALAEPMYTLHEDGTISIELDISSDVFSADLVPVDMYEGEDYWDAYYGNNYDGDDYYGDDYYGDGYYG